MIFLSIFCDFRVIRRLKFFETYFAFSTVTTALSTIRSYL